MEADKNPRHDVAVQIVRDRLAARLKELGKFSIAYDSGHRGGEQMALGLLSSWHPSNPISSSHGAGIGRDIRPAYVVAMMSAAERDSRKGQQEGYYLGLEAVVRGLLELADEASDGTRVVIEKVVFALSVTILQRKAGGAEPSAHEVLE